ncbi:hypothetical protein BIY23_01815 [Wolbachia pipientis]|uniref:Lipoprotein n=1 Tax=Wolbachia pipientis TaxID=955 RepID=A0A1E7QKL0_WOLPI|nr:hypothetical protein [Wolbachia pipientis]OEY86754.1 hypothetical protein BIY23_01815 [Wolbachia pipientis]
MYNKLFEKRNILPFAGLIMSVLAMGCAIYSAVYLRYNLLPVKLVSLGSSPALLGIIVIVSLIAFISKIYENYSHVVLVDNLANDLKETMKKGKISQTGDGCFMLNLSFGDYKALKGNSVQYKHSGGNDNCGYYHARSTIEGAVKWQYQER